MCSKNWVIAWLTCLQRSYSKWFNQVTVDQGTDLRTSFSLGLLFFTAGKTSTFYYNIIKDSWLICLAKKIKIKVCFCCDQQTPPTPLLIDNRLNFKWHETILRMILHHSDKTLTHFHPLGPYLVKKIIIKMSAGQNNLVKMLLNHSNHIKLTYKNTVC